MRVVRVLSLLLLTCAATVLGSCASAGSAVTGDAFTVPIEVDNNLTGFSGVTIYIHTPSGSQRRLLGPVEAGRKQTFQHDARAGTYVLTARHTSAGDDIVSERFQLAPGASVQWSLQQNRLLLATP